MKLLIAAGLMTFCGSLAAADLDECMSIRDDTVRLFCYDKAAGRPAASAQKTQAPPAETAPVAVEPTEQKMESPPAAEARPKAKKERIEARIVGRFEGWSRGTRFELDNGEVWESIGSGTHYSKSDSPAVSIERDFFGQHLMAVEGVKSKAIVQRVDEP